MSSADPALQGVLLQQVQATADSIAPGYAGFRGQAPEPRRPNRGLVRWTGPGRPQRALRRLAATLPAPYQATLLPCPAPVLIVAADRATLRAMTRLALLAGLGLPDAEWDALWATYHAVRGRVAPPANPQWHEWTEPARQAEDAA